MRWQRGGELRDPPKLQQVHHRILFLLDRLAERRIASAHRLTPTELQACRTVGLQHYASLGFYRGASVLWDALAADEDLSDPSPAEQLLLLYTIRQSAIGIFWPDEQQIDLKNQSIDHGSAKEIDRMIERGGSLGALLLHAEAPPKQALIVRWVTEILASAQRVDDLERWLRDQLGVELHFPDAGAAWTDPALTSAVVRMWRGRGELGKMIGFYHAAVEPSGEMCSRRTPFGFFSPAASLPTGETRAETYAPHLPVTTRTFHDLIASSVACDRIHLALHFLTQVVERAEAYAAHLAHLSADAKGAPPTPPLRLQPATYQALIGPLFKKRRSTQLKAARKLAQRALESVVVELEWYHHRAAHRTSSARSEEREEWARLLEVLVPRSATEGYRSLELAVFRPVLALRSQAEDAGEGGELVVAQERVAFLGRSLRHGLRLVDRLDKMFERVELTRRIARERALVKWLERRKQKGLVPRVKWKKRESQVGGMELKIERAIERVEKLVEDRRVGRLTS